MSPVPNARTCLLKWCHQWDACPRYYHALASSFCAADSEYYTCAVGDVHRMLFCTIPCVADKNYEIRGMKL